MYAADLYLYLYGVTVYQVVRIVTWCGNMRTGSWNLMKCSAFRFVYINIKYCVSVSIEMLILQNMQLGLYKVNFLLCVCFVLYIRKGAIFYSEKVRKLCLFCRQVVLKSCIYFNY